MSAADFPADPPRLPRTGSVLARARTATDRGNGWRRLVVGAGLAWLPLGAPLVSMTALVYVTVQQSLRSGANDPQIQIAGDLAAQLGGGADPFALLGTAKVDL